MIKRLSALRTLPLATLFMAALLPMAAAAHTLEEGIYNPGRLPPRASTLKVKPGDPAPDFTLPAVQGGEVTLSDHRGKHNVLLSFVPAAWTPVCSDQWPGYNLALELITSHDTVLLGITADNLPSQFAWIEAMGGLDFPVLSDFWPHGAAAERFGVLRSDGMTERALILIDKQGVVRFAYVEDINKRPDLGMIMHELGRLTGK